MNEIVFVYGTLRKGGSNHHRMAGAVERGPGTVRGRLFQVDWYPGLLLDETGVDIRGEAYEVDATTLAALDAFEGSHYRRVSVRIMPTDGGVIIDAWIWEYIAPIDDLREITSGDWFDVEHPL